MNNITDINSSIWVSASAGSGKTKNLIDRIISLLLAGVKPEKILCITFTKNAAIEMQQRLLTFLSNLKTYDLTQMNAFLAGLGIKENNNINISSIIKKVTENGVRIQTIHSFCQSILACNCDDNLAFSGATICDQTTSNKLLEEAYTNLCFAKEHDFLSEISDLVFMNGSLLDTIQNSISKIRIFFYKFNINSREDICKIYNAFFDNENQSYVDFLKKELNEYKEKYDFNKILDAFAENSAENALKIQEIFSENFADFKQNTDEFKKIFLTNEHKIRTRILTKDIINKYDISESLRELGEIFFKYTQIEHANINNNFNIRFFSLVLDLIKEYNKIKASRNILDYDDLLLNTVDLLKNDQATLFNTCNNIEHILVDEAQDTSALQWEIITPIIDEFYSHQNSGKTAFIVGDKKQSIYSFQGADSSLFEQKRKEFREKCKSSGQTWHEVSLQKSYRSTPEVIDFVNYIFKDAFDGEEHSSNRIADNGCVNILPIIKVDNDGDDITKVLAENIANYIKNILDKNVYIPSKKRNVLLEDFMILFQHRGDLMQAVANALSNLGINSSGPDNVNLSDELLVEDLLALAEFSCFQHNDLLTARVLKGPFANISDLELHNICTNRCEKSLWSFFDNLGNLGESYVKNYKKIREKLRKYIESSAENPADFFSNMIFNGDLQTIVENYKSDAKSLFYSFLEQCTNIGSEVNGSLYRFISEFKSRNGPVKQNIADAGNCVKLMTAHGSKGLQAPIVIIADADFYNTRNSEILSMNNFCIFPVLSAPTEKIDLFIDVAKEEKRLESIRLMYVAFTRAEDFLIVFAKEGQRKNNENCWYNVVLNNVNSTSYFNKNIDEIFYNCDVVNSSRQTQQNCFLSEKDIENLKNSYQWTHDSKVKNINYYQTEEKNIEALYGEFVHFLLQKLPSFERSYWREFALANNSELTGLFFESAFTECVNVLNDKKLSKYFDNTLANELCIYDNDLKCEIRIDKLCLINGKLVIVDFKTGEPFLHIKEYKKQIQKYSLILAKLYPDYKIEAVIIWTKTREISFMAI